MNFKPLYLLLAALIVACSDSQEVKVVDTNFKEEVPVLGNLIFTFNKNLVPDSLTDRWDSIPLIKFSPSIPGKFKWKSVNELIFSPSGPLPPATAFSARLTNKLLSNTKGMSLDDEGIKFHTPLLEMESAVAFWTMPAERGNSAVVQVDLKFNFPVSPGKAAEKLSVAVGGKEEDFSLVTSGKNSKVSFFLSKVKMDDADLEAVISMPGGLIPDRGNMPMEAVTGYKIIIPSPFNLSVLEFVSDHDGTEGKITFTLSQSVPGTGLDGFITLKPPVSFKVDVLNDGFVVRSDGFDASEKYEIVIREGLQGKLGGKLKTSFSGDVAFGKLKPSIQFAGNKPVYLSAKGFRNIAVSIVSVPKIQVRVSKVYENNILSALRYGYSSQWNSGYSYDDEQEEYYWDYYEYDSYETSNLGDVIWEEEMETSALPRQGSRRLLNFDFDDKLTAYKGLYVVEVASSDKTWLKAKRFISISDLGLIAKEGEQNVLVFVNSLKTAEPLGGVKVSVIGHNNQVIKTVATDAGGVALIPIDRKAAPGFQPALFTAQLGTDFNYLPVRNTQVSSTRFDVGGKRKNDSGYDGFIYGDRDIYRPGEKVHVSAIVRDFSWKSPGPVPVSLKLLLPDGREYKSIRKVLSDQGSFESSIQLSPSVTTGTYTLELFSSTGVLISSRHISVEEFVPDRIKVNIAVDKTELRSGEDFTVSLEALNLFGPPAAGRNYEVEMTLNRSYFSAAGFNEYNFNIENAGRDYFDKNLREGTTGEDGKATQTFDISPDYKDMGILRAEVFVTVFDETGRPVNRRTSVERILTQEVFYGVKGHSGYGYNALRTKMNFPLVAVDARGKALSGRKAEIKLIKWEWKTVLSKSGTYFNYTSQREEKILDFRELTLNGTETIYSFIPELSGDYELRISAPGKTSYVSSRFYVYGYGWTSSTSFEVNNEGHVDIELDKESYETGEAAKILFTTPFAGKMLVTVENDNVLKHFYLQTDKKSAAATLDLLPEYLPNVYITATLFRPHAESDMPLTVAHGFTAVYVTSKATRLPVAITAPAKSRSKTPQKITVKSQPGAHLTVAVVDEGILQLTGFPTPDPHNFFYQKRGLAVSSYNVYPYLFPEISDRLSGTGGDGTDMGKRVNPITNKRIKLVAFWSGILTADSKGEASYSLTVPQFSGDLRIMAVAHKDAAFGSASSNMKVADPIVISSSIPRFLSPGDTLVMPVTFSNTTDKKADGKVSLKTSGLLEVAGEKEMSVSIKPNSEQRVIFKALAANDIGTGQFTVACTAMGETFTEETDITIRPASPLQKKHGSGYVAAGKTAQVSMSTEGMIPSSVSWKLTVARTPLVQFTSDLEYLVGYPYGCIEQTISRAFPQIYFTDIAREVLKAKGDDPNPNYHVQEAIRKLMSMQVYNGGLTYWPGTGTVSWWSTVYAAHFLVEAKKAGFEVDPVFLSNITRYLKMRLKEKETMDYYYNGGLNRKISPKEVAYSLYVLALAGEQQRPEMNYYKSHLEELSLDARYLLAGAYALSGDKTRYQEILPPAFEGEKSDRASGGSFYSYIRDEAIAVNVMLEVDPENPQIGIMANHLSEQMKNSTYLNTQERSFGFLAMGKIARRSAGKNVTATITSGGKTVGEFKGDPVTFTEKQIKSQDVSIQVAGDGRVYYFWESEGITADGSFTEEDSYIKVRKTFLDRYGRPIRGNLFEQNDLVVVNITIQGLMARGTIENVAISDLLPAGFEIENPRLSDIPGMGWVANASYADYMDIRDDRINLFVNVGPTARNYFYAIRAVSLGSFRMGPVGADAMYNGEYHSYSGAGVIRVVPKRQ